MSAALKGLDLWHVREDSLPSGAVIEPGRWGRVITSQGQSHRFFYREQFLELYRVSQTAVPVSRLACSFAFEDRRIGEEWASHPGQFLHRVEPADPDQPSVRLDMLWITWMGEAGSTFETNMVRCRSYWSGRSSREAGPAANPAWEWLFAGSMRVTASGESLARLSP